MKHDVNLLPQSYSRTRAAWVRLVPWAAIWVAFVIVVSGVYWVGQRGQQLEEARLVALESEYVPVRKRASEVAATKTLIENLSGRESLALALADEQPMLSLLGVLSRAASQCDGEVSIQFLQLVPAPVKGGQSERHVPDRLLTIKGIGVNNLAVARFVASLRDSQVFDAVELTSAGGSIQKNDPSCTYHLECTF